MYARKQKRNPGQGMGILVCWIHKSHTPHKHPNVYSCDTLMELTVTSEAVLTIWNRIPFKQNDVNRYHYSVSGKNKSGRSVGVTGTMGEECRHLERAVCDVFWPPAVWHISTSNYSSILTTSSMGNPLFKQSVRL